MGSAASLSLHLSSLKARAQLFGGCQVSHGPEAQKSNGGKEGIGPEEDFCPPLPHPRPPSAKGLRLRALARDGGGGWGRREEGETWVLPVPPSFPWPPWTQGWVAWGGVSEADRSAPSFLPAGGRGGAGWGAGSDPPSPGPQGPGVSLNPACRSRGPGCRRRKNTGLGVEAPASIT